MHVEFDATGDDVIGLWRRLFRRSPRLRQGLRRRWLMHAGMAVAAGVLVFAVLDGVEPTWRIAQSGGVVAVALAAHAIHFPRWMRAHLRHAAAAIMAGRATIPIKVQIQPEGVWCAHEGLGFGMRWRDVVIEPSDGYTDFVCDDEVGMTAIGVPDHAFASPVEREAFHRQVAAWQAAARQAADDVDAAPAARSRASAPPPAAGHARGGAAG